ncbi:MAG: SusD/RagB family nutrient-binding outer membrane lipoprotein [Cyclobacteriaceae bacterium]
MKRFRLYIYLSICSSILLVSACGDFLNVNTDQTRLKVISTPLVLSAAQTSMAFHQGSDLFLYSSIIMQQATGNGVTGGQTRFYDQYIITNADVNNAWNAHYSGALADFDYIRKNTYAEGNPQYGGIAKILQAYNFSILVAAWGDIPYKEALKGTRFPQPKYDNSKEVYDSLFLLVDSGIADLAKTNVRAVGAEDLIYAGDMGKWTRFANTLKLRLALHYAKDDNGAKLNALINSGAAFMVGNGDNFQLSFENVTNRQNPIHQFELLRQDQYWPGKYMIDIMNTKSDPRRTTYFTPINYPKTFPYTPTITDTYVGLAPGVAQSVAASRIGVYLRGSVTADNGTRASDGSSLNATSLTFTGIAPIRMLTFAEYNFIRAEASLSYGASGSAATFFANGIDASMSNSGLSAAALAAATAYKATQTALPLTVQLVIEEKYIANYGVAMEPWTDWRRTGFPNIPVSAAAVAQANTVVPRILVYPLSETQVNADNLPPRASLIVKGAFWDK